MSTEYPINNEPFTIFRSAAEEAAMKIDEEKWENEGGHLAWRAGHVTHLAGAALAYTAVLTRARGETLLRSFATMREAEAFIRRSTPLSPPALSTLYDRPASDG